MNNQKREFELANEINPLSDDELDVVSGGFTLNFGKVVLTYTKQNADGAPAKDHNACQWVSADLASPRPCCYHRGAASQVPLAAAGCAS